MPLLSNNNKKLYSKLIGRYNRNALPVLHFLFNDTGSDDSEFPVTKTVSYFPQIESYLDLKLAAIMKDLTGFRKHMKKLPWRTVMGFRNTYKLEIEKSEILGASKMSDRDLIQTQTAQKRSGAKTVRKVNYKKQDLYDLWKLYYHKLLNNDGDEMDKIVEALDYIDSEMGAKMQKLEFGDVAVVLDLSHSMRGSDQRPLHPMLTAMCLLSTISTVKTIHTVSGKRIKIEGTEYSALVASGASPLWQGLVEAVLTGAEKIIVISDGYENAVKGMFNHVYKHFKNSGKEFQIIHINPVFSSDAKSGTSRSLVEDAPAIPVANYKHLETEFIFRKMLDHTEMVKDLLIARYQKLIGR
jgi:hypothetical protein